MIGSNYLLWEQFIDTSSEESDELDAWITGTMEKQVILRIGAKQRVMYCTDNTVRENIESVSPTKAKLAVRGGDIISFTPMD